MSNLQEIVDHAIADYGFRQAVVYGPEEIIKEWGLSEAEATTLRDVLVPALQELPIPVEPANIPVEEKRFALMIQDHSR